MSDRVQTVPAGAGEVGGGRGVLGDGVGEEGGARRLGHWIAAMGTGKTWVSAAQNKSEGPGDKKKTDENSSVEVNFAKSPAESTTQTYHTHRRRDAADGIVLSTEDH